MIPQNLLQNPLALTTQKCTLGCPILDRCLAGGVPCNSITELVAESGSGKTQLCLQLVLSAQLPTSLGGLAASSLYIHSEFPFPSRRLQQLSQSFRSSYSHVLDSEYNPLDFVLVRGVQSADQLFDVLLKMDSVLLRPPTQLPVRLIVIDSIAALFRGEFENTPFDLKRRSSLFFKISGKLKALAERVGNLGSLWSSGRRVCAALGLSWANCVNSRLFLSRNEEIVGEVTGLGGVGAGDTVSRLTRRHLHVIFAPHLPESSCEFVISREGVLGVER
ncbi:DNA repair protein XRCC3-like [Vitis vinifera]|uniref:DNA repair protein XRCC3-like n=1 Tax=Vitis vinifera TaxID=29760 RepID=A0A438CXR5_VITVI|nr:DNA repair protein XRCC3-like [Vitis vinifera]